LIPGLGMHCIVCPRAAELAARKATWVRAGMRGQGNL